MIFGSLFTGIGGFDLGLERAGMRCAWMVEKDAHCRKLLAARWPAVPLMEDVRDVEPASLAPVDLVCGGFPCQDLSVAGRRAGLAGERSGLWFEFHRILAGTRPRWCVIENVPGLLSSHDGRDFAALVRGLVLLGYRVAWRVLDAQHFGLAQRRKRVFVVGSLGDGGCATVLLEPESLRGDPPSRGEAGARAAAGAASRAVGRVGGGDDPGAGKGAPLIAETLRVGGRDQGAGSSSDNTPLTFAWQNGAGYGDAHDGLAITRDGSGPLAPSQVPAVAWALQERDGKGPDSDTKTGHLILAPPLTGADNRTGGSRPPGTQVDTAESLIPFNIVGGAQHSRSHAYRSDRTGALQGKGNSASGNEAGTTILQNVGVRRLTPRECERLQGFPDDWTAGFSDSVRYRMLGNAVAVPVAEWIGRRLVSP